MELTDELAVACSVAEAAGEVLLAQFTGEAVATRSKERRQEVVTEADLASEVLILHALAGRWPDDAVLAEERGAVAGRSGRTWCVDPLDGTANFASGVAHWAVVIALLVDGRPVVGVMRDPVRRETYAALAGGRATCNGEQIRVAAAPDVEDAVLADNLPYRLRHGNPLADRMTTSRGLRESGSMALDLAWTARGRLNAELHERSPRPWDYLAGELLIESAGGAVIEVPGLDGIVVCANPDLAANLIERFPPREHR